MSELTGYENFMCNEHNPKKGVGSSKAGAGWYCTCTYVAGHIGLHQCTCGFEWPLPTIEDPS